MTSDHRITPGLIHDIVDALERHGYNRSDDLHADRAIGLIGDLACIYEGTQDHPATAYPIAVPPPPAYPRASSHDAITLTRADASTVFAASDIAADDMEHPGFGGDSILPRCSRLGGRCLPRYRRLAEPRSDHFSAFVLSNICPAALSSCPAWWRAPPARPPRGLGISSSGTPVLRRGFPGLVKGDAQRHRLRRRRRP